MIMLDLIQPTALCEAVGVEEINGLVQNAKGSCTKCQMVRDTKRQRTRVRNAKGLVERNSKDT